MCIAYSFLPLYEMPDIFRHFMKCLTSQIACNIYMSVFMDSLKVQQFHTSGIFTIRHICAKAVLYIHTHACSNVSSQTVQRHCIHVLMHQAWQYEGTLCVCVCVPFHSFLFVCVYINYPTPVLMHKALQYQQMKTTAQVINSTLVKNIR